jgi:methionyl-tRNA synthetase
VLPTSTAKIWSQLGYSTSLDDVTIANLHWGHLKAGQRLGVVEGVFPRADAKVAIEKMKAGEAVELARQQALLGKTAPPPAPAAPPSDTITIDDFVKVDLRVGMVKSAAAVKGADKLLHLAVDIGEPTPRSIVAGIALAYKPEALVGRKVVIVANLAPRKLRGLESQGMIVAASLGDGAPVLAAFLEDVPIGARLK